MVVTELKWVKAAFGYVAETPNGCYKAYRMPTGKFQLCIDGHDLSHPRTLAAVKEMAAGIDDDRNEPVTAESPETVQDATEPSADETPVPIAETPTPAEYAARGGQYRSPSPADYGDRPEPDPVEDPKPVPTTTGLAGRLKALTAAPAPTDSAPHLIVSARAGSGKTTTLIEGLKVMRGLPTSITPSDQQRAVWDALALSAGAKAVGMVAFNKAIAEELQRRVPPGVEAMTMHSLGFAAVRTAFPGVRVNQYKTGDLIGAVSGRDPKAFRKQDPTLFSVAEKMVGLCKVNLAHRDETGADLGADDPDWPGVLDALAAHYDVDVSDCRAKAWEMVPKVLDACRDVAACGCVDFDDMVWLPVALGLTVRRYDLLLVDEAQDLGVCQQALAKKAGRRLVFVGDPHQAIYGFAGADSDALPRLGRELGDTVRGCTTIPLTVTRRCGKAIVAEARKTVPDFHAHESNPAGMVTRSLLPTDPDGNARPADQHYTRLVRDGDMVLCRNNAPLVRECFRFLKLGRKATIRGRDIAAGLVSTVKKLEARTIPELLSRLAAWLELETAKEQAKKNPNETRIAGLHDRHDCLVCFADGVGTVDAVVARIESIFTDDKTVRGVQLSSIHKAKGLEAARVFLLQPAGAEVVPDWLARKPAWETAQARNLLYVAVTRAVEYLCYVT
ncbi:MAG: UvrD-helicase domain-containing protein [Fimbriiglobus sp.]